MFFGINSHDKVQGFSQSTEYVPEIDPDYHFDPDTTKSNLGRVST